MNQSINEMNAKINELKNRKICKNSKEYALAYYHKTNNPTECEGCGKHITKYSLSRHLKSKKHIAIMELLEEIKKEEIRLGSLEKL